MRERPILFSAPMVRAILEGRKTQTRRAVKFPRARDCFVIAEEQPGVLWPYQSDDGESMVCSDGCEHPYASPYGRAGDRLWVRETWHTVDGESAFYRADYKHDPEGDKAHGITWRPSIFMPRWASRITLEITGVRVGRLQDISEADALAEGVMPEYAHRCADLGHPYTAIPLYRNLWNSINGPESWADNPFVWVVEFKRHV